MKNVKEINTLRDSLIIIGLTFLMLLFGKDLCYLDSSQFNRERQLLLLASVICAATAVGFIFLLLSRFIPFVDQFWQFECFHLKKFVKIDEEPFNPISSVKDLFKRTGFFFFNVFVICISVLLLSLIAGFYLSICALFLKVIGC